MLLDVKNLDVRYGRTQAVKSISLHVDEGEIVTVLGANGAGKSSLLKAIQGLVTPAAGEISYAGQVITRQRVDQRIQHGLVMVPEGRQILVSLTIYENLLLGAYTRKDMSRVSAEIDEIFDRFPNLAQRRDMDASCLSGGEQQMLAIGRALLAQPRLMMLDEPSLGLSPLFVQRLFDLIRSLNKSGISILLVEQNTNKALSVAARGYLLELGKVIASGRSDVLRNDDLLREAYLGRATV